MNIDASFVPRLASKARLKFDRHEGYHLLLYPERGLMLSRSAAAVALRCDGTRSAGQIARELAGAAAPGDAASMEARILADVLLFLQDLANRGLLAGAG